MEKEKLFEAYIKPEIQTFELNTENAILQMSDPQEISENDQMQNFDKWQIWE